MHVPAARPVRASLLLAVMAAALTLVAGASAAAYSPDGATNATPPTAPGVTEPGGGGGQPGNPGDPDGVIPIGPFDPAPTFPGDGAVHVTPVPGVTDAHRAAIDHISVAADGVTLTIYWYGGVEACYALSEVQAARDGNGLLVITVLEGTRPGLDPNLACIELAQLKATTITLDAPLFRDGSQIWDQ
jgi:hypothetical protein